MKRIRSNLSGQQPRKATPRSIHRHARTLGLMAIMAMPIWLGLLGPVVGRADAASLVIDLQAPMIDNNIARFPVEGQFIPDTAGDLIQSLQIGLKLPDTNAAIGAIKYRPVPLFDNPFFFDFDPSDAGTNQVNAFMSVNDLFTEGLPAGTHALGTIEVNLLQAGVAVGDPLTIDITRLDPDHGTSAFFGNPVTLSVFEPVDILFLDIGNNNDPADDGRRTLTVPPPTEGIPEPSTALLLTASVVLLRRRRR